MFCFCFLLSYFFSPQNLLQHNKLRTTHTHTLPSIKMQYNCMYVHKIHLHWCQLVAVAVAVAAAVAVAIALFCCVVSFANSSVVGFVLYCCWYSSYNTML